MPDFYSFPIIDYAVAHEKMEKIVQEIYTQKSNEQIWFLEHFPVYTAGTSAKNEDLLNPQFPVIQTGRGGQYTYHGPGQLVVYAMLQLRQEKKDIKAYVQALMDWVSLSLRELNLHTMKGDDHIGLWVEHNGKLKKIAAFGIRVTKWITWHGLSLNIHPHLDDFKGIVPCGIQQHGVTSLYEQGINVSRQEIEELLQKNFFKIAFFQK